MQNTRWLIITGWLLINNSLVWMAQTHGVRRCTLRNPVCMRTRHLLWITICNATFMRPNISPCVCQIKQMVKVCVFIATIYNCVWPGKSRCKAQYKTELLRSGKRMVIWINTALRSWHGKKQSVPLTILRPDMVDKRQHATDIWYFVWQGMGRLIYWSKLREQPSYSRAGEHMMHKNSFPASQGTLSVKISLCIVHAGSPDTKSQTRSSAAVNGVQPHD